jgi:hypothetical protein
VLGEGFLEEFDGGIVVTFLLIGAADAAERFGDQLEIGTDLEGEAVVLRRCMEGGTPGTHRTTFLDCFFARLDSLIVITLFEIRSWGMAVNIIRTDKNQTHRLD